MCLPHAGSGGEVPCLTWPSRAPPAASAASNRSSARRRRGPSSVASTQSHGTASTCPARTSSIASSRLTRPLAAGAAQFQGACYATAGSPAPATSRSCRSTRASSTPRGASFAKNPIYFDGENIVKLAIEGGCNAVASTLGVLGSGRAQVRAQDSVPREDQPQRVPDLSRTSTTRSCSASVKQAFDMGAVAVGATIYFGSDESTRQIQEVAEAFAAGARAGHGDGALVLPAQHRVQDQDEGLPPRRRPDRPGEPPRRHDPGRHHQAEAAREQRRLQRARSSARPTSASTPS